MGRRKKREIEREKKERRIMFLAFCALLILCKQSMHKSSDEKIDSVKFSLASNKYSHLIKSNEIKSNHQNRLIGEKAAIIFHPFTQIFSVGINVRF